MSIKYVKSEIVSFLSRDEAKVITITGKWGVGKTHLWNAELKQAIKDDRISRGTYAYISLFGHNNLSDVKTSLITETKDVQRVSENFDAEGIIKDFKNSYSNLKFYLQIICWIPTKIIGSGFA